MIPKTIHYCWFGYGEKNKLTQKCIGSWNKYCEDYKIIEWNENNFDIEQNEYMKWCYSNKKWAFLSDLARLIIIEENGGIYLDTDVQIIKCLDRLLTNDAYFGFETNTYINTGLGFGASPHHKIIKEMISEYDNLVFKDGKYQLLNCPHINTKALEKYGLTRNGTFQEIEGIKIFPQEYFNPYNDSTGELLITNNTYSIHWYGKSWMRKRSVMRNKLTQPFHRLFGEDCFHRLVKKLR